MFKPTVPLISNLGIHNANHPADLKAVRSSDFAPPIDQRTSLGLTINPVGDNHPILAGFRALKMIPTSAIQRFNYYYRGFHARHIYCSASPVVSDRGSIETHISD